MPLLIKNEVIAPHLHPLPITPPKLNIWSGKCQKTTRKISIAVSLHHLSSIQFCPVQSLDRLGRRGDMRDDSAEIIFQSFLQEALASSAGMGYKRGILLVWNWHSADGQITVLLLTVKSMTYYWRSNQWLITDGQINELLLTVKPVTYY